MSNANTENATRGRGRPASFPGIETVKMLASIPVTAQEQLRAVAAKRGEPINVTLARFIERGHKDAMRSRERS
jgi:hypothetical protein